MANVILSMNRNEVFYQAVANTYLNSVNMNMFTFNKTEYVYNSYDNANMFYKTITERVFLETVKLEVMVSLVDQRTVTFPEESANVTISHQENLYISDTEDNYVQVAASDMEVMFTQGRDVLTKGKYDLINQEALYTANVHPHIHASNMEILIVFPVRRRPIYHPS